MVAADTRGLVPAGAEAGCPELYAVLKCSVLFDVSCTALQCSVMLFGFPDVLFC